jgi:hypothetical protein
MKKYRILKDTEGSCYIQEKFLFFWIYSRKIPIHCLRDSVETLDRLKTKKDLEKQVVDLNNLHRYVL